MKSDYTDKLIWETSPYVEKLIGKESAATVLDTAQKFYYELVAENVEEPKAMHAHTHKHIYPGIALFCALTEAGVSRRDAAELFRQFYRNRAERPAAAIRKLLKIPGLYKLIPRVFKSVVQKRFGTDAGFQAIYYDVPKGEFRADMVGCPYLEICRKYNCPEIVPAFCETDDVAYGNMHPRLIWGRTKTLGKGGDCCDFRLTVKTNEETR